MSVFIGYPSFMAYQMMKGKKGNNDGFPPIPGMIARYSALGLTNEEMSKNPVWVDKTGNDHDLQMKNFAWTGMSGVGGYKLNWGDSSIWANYITQGTFGTGEVTDNTIHITSAKTNNALFETRASLKSVEYKVLIKGLTDDIYLRYGVFNDGKELWTEIKNDGIYTLPSYDYDSRYNMKWEVMSQTYPIDCDITLEQLPLYPGALVFDGVTDYGTCDNFPILTKEKGYTVVALRQWISMGEGISGLVSNVENWFNDGAFVLEYYSNNATNKFVNRPISFGTVNIEMDLPNNFTYQTSKSYKGVPITTSSFKGTNSLFIGKLNNIIGNCSNVAIWELVFLDHDATEKELTKIKDYFVKTYPWLFFDQAWTVVGKTNEDTDRATITNITGNGNDLVLSNFGFAEGSGYGLYGFKFFSKAGIEYYSGSKISFSKHQLDQITLIPYILVYPGTSYPRETEITAKIKVTGLKEGVSLTWGWAGNMELTITEDGTYSISAGSGKLRQLDVVYAEGFDPDHVVTIEQIPEYEGYLVTDGVDDKIVSAKSIAFTDTWTIITDAIFLGEKVVSAGILVKDIFGVSNPLEYGRVEVSVKGGVLLKVPTPSIKAICSDGRIYDADWNEYQAEPGTIKVSEGKLYIGMGYNGMQFCSIAFKNIATYNGYALSKDDCIKAYNYLQTLKAK